MATYKNPVLQKGEHKVTSKFGMRTITIKGKTTTSHHNGIDLVGEGATLDYIIAFADGVVTISKASTSAGEYVAIDHGNGVVTRYLHMKAGSRKVKTGNKVKKGQVLGYMGATGNVTGAHLHFDIKINGKFVDPAPYLEGTKSIFPEIKKATVKDWQKAAMADGFKFPKYGADGNWGAECEAVAKKAICKKQLVGYKYRNLTKIIQGIVGVKADGCFGKGTKAAVIAYQKKNGLTQDGCVGPTTWKKMLGVK